MSTPLLEPQPALFDPTAEKTGGAFKLVSDYTPAGDQPAAIYADGTLHWWKDGKRHRDGDQPAVIYANGVQQWWKDGKRHRDGDQPAYIGLDGILEWWVHGKQHRDGDQPAAVYDDGRQEWWMHGKQHRVGDGNLPVAMYPNGLQVWLQDGQVIRRTNVTCFKETSLRFAFVMWVLDVTFVTNVFIYEPHTMTMDIASCVALFL